jgi:protein associated with RNAse G/E
MEREDTSQQFAAVAPGTAVAVRAHKYDGREYRRWQVHFVELVGGGVHLEAIFNSFVEGRTPFFGGDRAVEFFYADRGYNVIAGYAPDGTLRACYCNICTPATFVLAPDGPEIHFIDLDLDVLVWPDGSCIVTDEDDFAENSVRYAYPATIQEGARTAVEALLTAVRDRQPPFDCLGLPAAS